MKKLFLSFLVLIVMSKCVNAYEFPFNLVKFKPHFLRLDGTHLVYKYVENFPSIKILEDNLSKNDKLFEKICSFLNFEPDKKRIKIYIYKSWQQKRKMLGTPSMSNIEDNAIHVVINSSSQLIGDMAPYLACKYLGKSSSNFLNSGLRFIFEPIFIGYNMKDVESVINEYGAMRSIMFLLKNSNFSKYNDMISKITASSFLRFIIEEYPITFFWKWYEHSKSEATAERFKEIYGFSIKEAETQWHDRLIKNRLNDKKFTEISDFLIKQGIELK